MTAPITNSSLEGMARAGLGALWKCVFADDIDFKKAASYAANWGSDELRVEDIGKLAPAGLPGVAMLAWASFPCQDLSLAGAGAGLRGERSGTFWPFWKLMMGLAVDARAPRLIVLENVCGGSVLTAAVISLRLATRCQRVAIGSEPW